MNATRYTVHTQRTNTNQQPNEHIQIPCKLKCNEIFKLSTYKWNLRERKKETAAATAPQPTTHSIEASRVCKTDEVFDLYNEFTYRQCCRCKIFILQRNVRRFFVDFLYMCWTIKEPRSNEIECRRKLHETDNKHDNRV